MTHTAVSALPGTNEPFPSEMGEGTICPSVPHQRPLWTSYSQVIREKGTHHRSGSSPAFGGAALGGGSTLGVPTHDGLDVLSLFHPRSLPSDPS